VYVVGQCGYKITAAFFILSEVVMTQITTAINALDRFIILVIKPIVAVISLFVALALSFGIYARSVLETPVFGLEELILIAAMWLYMLGAVLASRDRTHLSADFVQVISKNPKIISGFKLIATLISLFMACMFMTWSWDLLAWGLKKGQATTVLQIPWYFSQASLFVASLLFIVYLVRDMLNDFVEFRLAGK
jgi:TRAP-type C4-dicarboxylate transport system permease small subunit